MDYRRGVHVAKIILFIMLSETPTEQRNLKGIMTNNQDVAYNLAPPQTFKKYIGRFILLITWPYKVER